MFTGLSAFPLTPFADGRPDLESFATLVRRLVAAEVDSIGALGSTGSYAYLTASERREVTQVAVQAAGDIPVLIGVGAVSTREVLGHAAAAREAGAAGVLLAPVSYQRLTHDEVFGLYERVAAEAGVPVVLYDNPATTGVSFSDDLYARVAAIPGVVSIKLPPFGSDLADARSRVAALRAIVPTDVSLGISGDAAAARALLAGCDVWYSVLAGVFPHICRAITRAAQAGDVDRAEQLSAGLAPIWEQFARSGSYRVVSAIAAERGLVTPEGLHHPVQPLTGSARDEVRAALVRCEPVLAECGDVA